MCVFLSYIIYKRLTVSLQVVWKYTNEMGLGCAWTQDRVNGKTFVVAAYKPAGNIPRLLRKNVLLPGPRGNDPDVYSTLFRRQFKVKRSENRKA